MATTMTDDTKTKETGMAEELAHLRAQVDELMHGKVAPAVADMRDKIEKAAHVAGDTVKGQADALSGRVRDQPLVALLLAAGVGFLIGRVMR